VHFSFSGGFVFECLPPSAAGEMADCWAFQNFKEESQHRFFLSAPRAAARPYAATRSWAAAALFNGVMLFSPFLKKIT
jgi:hypothetical protein